MRVHAVSHKSAECLNKKDARANGGVQNAGALAQAVRSEYLREEIIDEGRWRIVRTAIPLVGLLGTVELLIDAAYEFNWDYVELVCEEEELRLPRIRIATQKALDATEVLRVGGNCLPLVF